MTDYLTEEEQIELFKNWVKQYSLVIIAGIAFAIVIVTGWRYWQERQANILNHASTSYDELLTARSQNDIKVTLAQAEKLFSQYPQTSYGQMAALFLAKNALVKKDYPEAESKFLWIIDHSKIPSVRQIARIRLARVMLAEHKPEEAIKILQKVEDKNFNGLTNEVRGDAYLALKNIDSARQAYQMALNELPNAESVRPLLQMKYENLTTTTIK